MPRTKQRNYLATCLSLERSVIVPAKAHCKRKRVKLSHVVDAMLTDFNQQCDHELTVSKPPQSPEGKKLRKTSIPD